MVEGFKNFDKKMTRKRNIKQKPNKGDTMDLELRLRINWPFGFSG